MILGPSRRTRELLNMMADPFELLVDLPTPSIKANPLLMKTDIKEVGGAYKIAIDLPGCKKEDIDIELKDGYLAVSASKETESEDKDEAGTFIRKERFSGKSSRSFYVGEEVLDSDIKAKFEDGVLNITVPKKEEETKVDVKKSISID
ncbi:MAG: Hsp20/alpha crystallin family protein [Raoultibacter sp.]|jgi:HSP20 family protein